MKNYKFIAFREAQYTIEVNFLTQTSELKANFNQTGLTNSATCRCETPEQTSEPILQECPELVRQGGKSSPKGVSVQDKLVKTSIAPSCLRPMTEDT